MGYYMSVGSGVWINVGNTAVYKDHPDMVSDMIGKQCSDRADAAWGRPEVRGGNHTECENNLLDVYSAARSQSIDTIQITGHNDCTCGPVGPSSERFNRQCYAEIMVVAQAPDLPVCSGTFKGGWEADDICACESLWVSNHTWGIDHYANCGRHLLPV